MKPTKNTQNEKEDFEWKQFVRKFAKLYDIVDEINLDIKNMPRSKEKLSVTIEEVREYLIKNNSRLIR